MAAWMCVEGEGGDPDFEYAARTFRKAAKSGDGRAQHQLGWMYLNGDGVVQDDTQAVAWFTKSAANGTLSGQANLAECHLNGWGVERDVFEAGRLYRLAALQGRTRSGNSAKSSAKARCTAGSRWSWPASTATWLPSKVTMALPPLPPPPLPLPLLQRQSRSSRR